MQISHIKNAFANIQTCCEQKLQSLYPHGIPEPVQKRYRTELQYLKQSPWADDFEIFRRMSLEAQKSAGYFTLRGTAPNSYLVYLLGQNQINPLPAHYYCPSCGYFETADTGLFAPDLPKTICPRCKAALTSDGYNLTADLLWGPDGKTSVSFEYNIYTDFLPFAKKVLTELYPEQEIVPYGAWNLKTARPDNPSYQAEMIHSGYIILPPQRTMDDYPDMITYLENGDKCLTGTFPILAEHSLKRITMLPARNLDWLMELQRKSGIYINEIDGPRLSEITYHDIRSSRTLSETEEDFFSLIKPKNLSEMVSCISLAHNSYAGTLGADANPQSVFNSLIDTPPFRRYPCSCRDDFYEHLLTSGLDCRSAYQAARLISLGKASRSQELDNLPMPEELKDLARQYAYLLPRSHSVEYLLVCARLAFYMKYDSRLYSKIVFRHQTVS